MDSKEGPGHALGVFVLHVVHVVQEMLQMC